MLDYSDYIADWPDIPYPNFSAWLEDIAAQWPNERALLFRTGKQKDFTIWTFGHYAGECRRIARGLLAAGLRRGDRVALWAENRPEWMAVWMAAAIAGMVIVPVDYLVHEDECANILKITEAKAFFYSPRKQAFTDSAVSKLPFVTVRVCLYREDPPEAGAAVYFDSFGAAGVNTAGPEEQKLPSAADIAENDPVSVVFTSGTTGFAKGVTLSHKGIIANASAAIRSLRPRFGDMFLNVLPLHHTYPTCTQFISPLSIGVPVVIVDKLVGKVVVDAVRDAGVTHLIAVPLLFDKVKAAIEQGYNKLSPVIRLPLDLLRKISLAKAKKGRPEFGQAVFKFLRKKAGLGTVKLTVAGGGPLNPKTADFFDSLGFNMVNGYGMSENSPLISVSTPRYKNNASVGLPVKYTDVKILDKGPEGIGEIAVKSPSLMLGYYKNEEATKAVFTEDGYLLTGDLGYRDEQGFIFIHGRKKNLIVSPGGKNIYPEEIESRFDGSRVVGEILVVGRKQSGGEQILAVVVPNFEALEEDYPGKELSDEFIHNLVKREIEAVNRTLVVYKKIGNFILRREEFEKNAQRKIRRFMYKQYENATL
jgi:long-chain acyl-CoA synthetase